MAFFLMLLKLHFFLEKVFVINVGDTKISKRFLAILITIRIRILKIFLPSAYL